MVPADRAVRQRQGARQLSDSTPTRPDPLLQGVATEYAVCYGLCTVFIVQPTTAIKCDVPSKYAVGDQRLPSIVVHATTVIPGIVIEDAAAAYRWAATHVTDAPAMFMRRTRCVGVAATNNETVQNRGPIRPAGGHDMVAVLAMRRI